MARIRIFLFAYSKLKDSPNLNSSFRNSVRIITFDDRFDEKVQLMLNDVAVGTVAVILLLTATPLVFQMTIRLYPLVHLSSSNQAVSETSYVHF